MKGAVALAALALTASREFDMQDWPKAGHPKHDPAVNAERIAAAQAKRERRMERNRRLLTK
jgi:hypothetical protein